MKISKPIINTAFVSTIFLFLFCAHLLAEKKEKPNISISKQESSFNLKNNDWMMFHLGQKRMLSSLFWIATILESDIDHYKERDMNSWMFLRFKTISELDPWFYQNYNFGSIYLSIIKDDLPGASYMYDKGLLYYPDDLNLLSNAAFHYRFEIKDSQKAAPIFSKLAQNYSLPLSLIGSFAKIQANSNPQEAINVINETQKRIPKNHFIYANLESYKYALQTKIDLECLNNKKENCNKIDLKGKPYLIQNNLYKSNVDIGNILKE